MSLVKLAWLVLLGSLVIPSLSGCFGPRNCNPEQAIPDRELPSWDFDFCGTMMRWNGDADRLEVLQMGDTVNAWSHVRLSHGSEPKQGGNSWLRLAFNKQASSSSPEIEHTVTHSLGGYATSSMKVEDYFSFCRRDAASPATVYLDVGVNVADLGGGVRFVTQMRSC